MALQRVRQPTNLDVRRLNAVTRKLQKEPQKLTFHAMECLGICDIHTDSGYRRIESAEDIKGYGMRGMNLLRRGKRRTSKDNKRLETSCSQHNKENKDESYDCVHFVESVCKSHKLVIRSSYGAEALSAAHGIDDSYPTIITLQEIKYGAMDAAQLKHIREAG